jgi:ABC-type microcin C transport system permease subunit YejE
MFRLNPQTAKKVRRFKAIKRGYYSFLAVAIVVVITAFGELLVNSRALFVSYEGDWYFPTYTKFHPGTDFGLDYDYEVDYRALRAQWQEQGSDNWLLMPLVPYNPFTTLATRHSSRRPPRGVPSITWAPIRPAGIFSHGCFMASGSRCYFLSLLSVRSTSSA